MLRRAVSFRLSPCEGQLGNNPHAWLTHQPDSPVTRLTCRLRFVQKTVRVLTSAYSRALARAPAPRPSNTSFPTSFLSSTSSISFPSNRLRTLELSCRSFPTSRPLFSMLCGLFSQNTRGCGGGSRIPIRFLDSRRESTKIPGAGDACSGHPERGWALSSSNLEPPTSNFCGRRCRKAGQRSLAGTFWSAAACLPAAGGPPLLRWQCRGPTQLRAIP